MYEPPSSSVDTDNNKREQSKLNFILFVSLILTVIYWVMPTFDSLWLNEDETFLLSYSGLNAYFQMNSTIYWLLGFFWCTLNIGLLLRLRFVKSIFLITTLIFSVSNALSGMMVQTSIGFAIGNILSMLDGAILVFIYFTKVSNEFN